MQELMTISCPCSTRSGYGELSRDIIRHLIALNRFDIKVVPTAWGVTPPTALDDKIPEHKKLGELFINAPLTRKPEVNINVSITPEFQPVGQFNIGCTAGIETTCCPPEWIDGINKINLVVVTSQFAKHVFEQSKYRVSPPNQAPFELAVKTPVEVIPIAVNTDIFKPSKVTDTNINDMMIDIKEKFCFLFVGHWLAGGLGQDRKNVGMLIKTFIETFKDIPSATRPALILKTSGATFSLMDREEIKDKIKAIKDNFGNVNLPNIYLVHGDLTAEEMSALYNHNKVKAMVNFTRGEGFGIPLLEFSMVDKPIIASGYSGILDFLNTEDSLLIGGILEDAPAEAMWNGKKIDGAKWFTIDYKTASTAMRMLFKNYDRFIPKAEKLGKQNRERFSIPAVGAQWKTILDKYLPQFSMQAPLNLPQLKKLG